MRTFCAIFVFLFTLAIIPFASAADAPDEGYFLSLAQKGQLIWSGRIQDSHGDWYDVWVVPGYVAPSRIAREGLHDTGEAFGEYFAAQKYKDLAEDSSDAYRWAFKDTLYDFTIKGTPRAWGEHFGAAQQRTKQRVFGWWFAYPWAFFTSVTDNVFRIPVGIAGTALGTVWGTAVVPTWYLTNSAVEGIWYTSTGVILVPVAGYSWNTVIAPPLAMVGQKPAPSRVDGFWVSRLTNSELQQVEAATVALQEEDYARLAAWGKLLQGETEPYHQRMKVIDAQADAAIAALEAQREEQLKVASEEARRLVQALLQQPQRQALVTGLKSETAARMQQQPWRAGLRQRLAAQGMTSAAIEELLERISAYQDDLDVVVRPLEKTDPLKVIVTTPEQL